MPDLDSDAMLAFVNELTKRVQDLKKEVTELGEKSGGGMRKAGEEFEKFGQTVNKHTKTVHGMTEETGGLTKLITGPVGLIGGLFGMAKAMETFAIGELKVRNFALNVGMSVETVNRLTLQLRASGFSADEAASKIGGINSKLDEIKSLRETAPVYKELAANDIEFANNLLANVDNRLKQYEIIREKLSRADEPRSRIRVGGILGADPATIAALNKNISDLVQPKLYNEKEMDDYIRNWLNLSTRVQNHWGYAMHYMVGETNAFVASTEEEVKKIGGIWKKLTDEMKKPENTLTGPKGFLPNTEELKGLMDKLMGLVVSPAHGEEGGRGSLLQQTNLIDTEVDSNRVLHGIYNLMQEDRLGSGVHPGPGGPGRGGTLFRPGIRGGGGRQGDLGVGTDTAAIPAGAGTPNEAIAAQRKPLMDEINASPALREKVLSMLQSEESGVGPRTATAEALFNRVMMIQKHDPSWTVAKELASGFYGPINRGELRTTRGSSRAQSEAALSSAGGGSMVVQGRTDQGMAGDPNASGPGRVRVPGTSGIFNFWQGRRGQHFFSHSESERFAEEEKRMAEGSRNKLTEGLLLEHARRRMQQTDDDRKKIDGSFGPSGQKLGGAHIYVDFKGVPREVRTGGSLMDEGVFNTLKLNREPQAPQAGGGTADYNRFSFQ